MSVALTLDTAKSISATFLGLASVEITPKQIEKVPLIASKLPKGSRVYIALIDPDDIDGQFAAAAAVRAEGLEPVPHMPARFVKNRDDLARRLETHAKRGQVREMLVLGGGAPTPVGDYDAAIQLLETGLFQANGIKRLGIAGHPEGNPDITKLHGEKALLAALKLKQAYLKDHGIEGPYRHAVPVRGGARGRSGRACSGPKASTFRCAWACRGRRRSRRWSNTPPCAASGIRRASSANRPSTSPSF